MKSTLYVRMKKSEGALVRLLGLVTRRNYDVLGVSAKLTSDGTAFDVLIDFEGITPAEGPLAPWYRPPDLLARMVEKLCDVEKAELKEGGVR